MENKVIKNMEYWKKKNNIPGIEALADSGLTDGRAGSSAFQMATPGSSPNKGFLGNLGQGLIGKGKMGFLNPAMWAARGVKNTLDADPTTTNVLGGGVGGQMFGGMFGPAAGNGMQQDPAMAAMPVQTPMVMKSPMKQEEMMMEEKPTVEEKPVNQDENLVMVQADSFENLETGETVVTEDLQIDENGFIPVTKDGFYYYVTDNEGNQIQVSKDHESIVPRSVVEGVNRGPEMQEAIRVYKEGGEKTPGGVGNLEGGM